MPPRAPKPISRAIKCPHCRALEGPQGPQADGAANQRLKKGPQGPRRINVYHMRCAACGHEWDSSTNRAKALSQQVDREQRAKRDGVAPGRPKKAGSAKGGRDPRPTGAARRLASEGDPA